MIDLYTAGVPNCHKVQLAFEELGLKYNVHHLDLSKKVQKEEWYLKICPNGRVPAMVDHADGRDRRVFEGAPIMLYLCAKYDKSYSVSFPYDSDEYWECLQWLTWLQSGIGPMQGQATHFFRYAPKKIDYAIDRYQTETKRLYQILDDHLERVKNQGKDPWIIGGKYSIADMACFGWINWAEWAGVDTKPFTNVEKWMAEISKRPATQRAVNIPEPFKMKEALKTKEGEEQYSQSLATWVMDGQKEDQKKFS